MAINDVFFSLHAVALTLLIIIQCCIYEVSVNAGLSSTALHPTTHCSLLLGSVLFILLPLAFQEVRLHSPAACIFPELVTTPVS